MSYHKHYKIFLNKKYLSEKFVVTTRSINRTLRELSDDDIIIIDDDYIKIKNLQRLIEIAINLLHFNFLKSLETLAIQKIKM